MSDEQKKKENGGPQKETSRFADLPEVSVLGKAGTAKVKQARELLEELDSIQQLVDVHTRREGEIKQELEILQRLAGTPGLRWGNLCFTSVSTPGRETLDKVKLMEVAGVTAAQLKECMKTGKPFEVRTFKNLTRSRSQEGAWHE